MANLILPGEEAFFSKDDIIVSKTDLKGILTYTNTTFCVVSGFREKELLGQPHSIIRHDAMPRCVFKLIWDTIQTGQEIFGYVVNKTKSGGYYWVLAHVTPSFNPNGEIIGYHSNRRVPDRKILDTTIMPLYASLLEIENSKSNRKDGMMAAYNHLVGILENKGLQYDEFILTL